MKRFPLVLALVAAAGIGCEAEASDAGQPASDLHAGAGAQPEQPADPAASEPAFEPFEIPLEQAVTVGAFVLQLHSAHVEPSEPPSDPLAAILVAPHHATVRVDFDAHSASESVATPLAALDVHGRLLEAGGKYFFGELQAEPVPGLRDGKGILSWVISDEIGVEELRGAIVTLGEPAQNNAVIPFADPGAVITLADVGLEDRFIVSGYRQTTLDIMSARVQFNTRSDNVPLPAGKAWLVLEGVISADEDMSRYGETWGEEHVYLQRPDGVSVAPDWLNFAIYPGDREDLQLIFELTMPVAGSYTFGVTARDMPSVTHEIIVPGH